MFDVGVKGDGAVGDDPVIVEASRASRGDFGFCDTGFEENFLSSSIGILAALDGGGE